MSREHEPMRAWTDVPAKERGRELVRYAKALEARLSSKLDIWEICAAVYSESLYVSLRPSRARNLTQPSTTRNANLTFNVTRSIVDTEHATVTEADPRPTLVTEGGNRPQQDKATELQRAIDGTFSDQHAYETHARAELDKDVLGTGVTKTHRVGNRIAIDRVLISDMLIDEDLLGAGQDPQQAIHRQEIARKTVLAQLKSADAPERFLEAVRKAPAVVASSPSAGERADMIVVYDAYTLPIDVDNPGTHAWAVDGCDECIFEEEWTKPRLPFAFQFWQRPTTGFYGIGIVEQLLGLQAEVNRFFRTVSKSLKRWGVVTVLLPTTAKIDPKQWTNHEAGQFVPYDPLGGQPVPLNAALLSPEVMNWLQFVIDVMYKAVGVPQNTAFAQREAGIPSARGQREITQKAASRLSPQSKQYERALVHSAWCVDSILRELVEDGEKLEISTADQGALHRVDIHEAISLEPGTYKIDIFAGNLLSRHPASKREEVQELVGAKVFTPEEAKQLILRPDVEAAIGKAVDAAGIYKRMIDLAIRKDRYIEPDANWPAKELGVKLFSEALFENEVSGVAEARLDHLRNWLKQMKDIMQPPVTEAPADTAGAAPAQPQQEAAPQ
jgi:hypothetical protein